MVNLPITVGWWRSVGYSVNVFAVESFIDELAHAAGQDPVQFRLDHMEKGSRPYHILALAAEKGGWHRPIPSGRGRGVAVDRGSVSTAAGLDWHASALRTSQHTHSSRKNGLNCRCNDFYNLR